MKITAKTISINDLIRRLNRIVVRNDFGEDESVDFSFSPKLIETQIKCTLNEFVVTLALLFLIKDSFIIHHWECECYGFIKKYNINLDRKRDRSDFLLDCLWTNSNFVKQDKFMSVLKDKISKENDSGKNTHKLPFSREYLYVKDIIGEFMKDLASDIARKEITKEELDALIEKYRAEKCFQPGNYWLEAFN